MIFNYTTARSYMMNRGSSQKLKFTMEKNYIYSISIFRIHPKVSECSKDYTVNISLFVLFFL